jgi:hypothetical protein
MWMTWTTGWIHKCVSWPTDSHKRSPPRRMVTWYPTGSTSTMLVDSVSKTSSWHDVTCRVEPRWNNPYHLGGGKSNVTLHGYRMSPSILKKTEGILEIRPNQTHYVWITVWFPPKRPATTPGGNGLGGTVSYRSVSGLTGTGSSRWSGSPVPALAVKWWSGLNRPDHR